MKNFLKISWLSYKEDLALINVEEFILMKFLMPFFSLIFYCLVAKFSFQTSDVSYWVIGNSFLLCSNVCIFQLGNSLMAERFYGRMRSIITSPENKLKIIISKSLFPSLVAFLNVLFGLIVGGVIFDIRYPNMPLYLLIITMIISMFSASTFGLFIANFSFFTDSMHLVLNLIAMSLLILTGANFPITQLPKIFQHVSSFLPLTHGIKAAKLIFSTNKLNQIVFILIEEVLVGIFYFVLSYYTLKFVENYARKKANLEVF